jgi:hypothetical protein
VGAISGVDESVGVVDKSDDIAPPVETTIKLLRFLSVETLSFKDSITSPKLIIVISASYEPSALKDQLKLETLPKSAS